jgi:hypothetical protein
MRTITPGRSVSSTQRLVSARRAVVSFSRTIFLSLVAVELLGGVLISHISHVSAQSAFPECDSLRSGPIVGGKLASAMANVDNTVTVSVGTFGSITDAPSRPAAHMFDCVFEGDSSTGVAIGSTGPSGAACPRLPCFYRVTTVPEPAGTHTLCVAGRFDGFQDASVDGKRSPEYCLSVDVASRAASGVAAVTAPLQVCRQEVNPVQTALGNGKVGQGNLNGPHQKGSQANINNGRGSNLNQARQMCVLVINKIFNKKLGTMPGPPGRRTGLARLAASEQAPHRTTRVRRTRNVLR